MIALVARTSGGERQDQITKFPNFQMEFEPGISASSFLIWKFGNLEIGSNSLPFKATQRRDC